MNVKKLSASLSAALALGAMSMVASDAVAATETANLALSANVTANCTITTGAIAFGEYDPLVTNKIADRLGQGSVTVTCTKALTTKVTLGQGNQPFTGSTDAVPLRQMASGANMLRYYLFQDAAVSVWGNDVATGLAHTGTGLPAVLIVYGNVAMGQNVPAGAYTDTVVATVTF